MEPYDLQAIHRQFELYMENFPPDASGRKQFFVDAETWQNYCDLNFSQFPLHLIEDENETAAAITVAAVDTMAAENVEQVTDKQAAADRTADQEASKKADPEARQAGIKNKEDAAADKRAAEEVEQAAQKQAAVEAQKDAIRDKAVAAVDTMATAIEQYATALAAASRAVAQVSGEEFKGHRRAVVKAEIKASSAIDAADRLGQTAKKQNAPLSPRQQIGTNHRSRDPGQALTAFVASMTLAFYIYWTLRPRTMTHGCCNTYITL